MGVITVKYGCRSVNIRASVALFPYLYSVWESVVHMVYSCVYVTVQSGSSIQFPQLTHLEELVSVRCCACIMVNVAHYCVAKQAFMPNKYLNLSYLCNAVLFVFLTHFLFIGAQINIVATLFFPCICMCLSFFECIHIFIYIKDVSALCRRAAVSRGHRRLRRQTSRGVSVAWIHIRRTHRPE